MKFIHNESMHKELRHLILKWVRENTLPPKHVQIIPTNACNINCIFCWERERWNKGLKKDRISDERLLEITREFCKPNLQPKQATITGGGEPLLKKDIVLKMVKEIKKYPIECEIITNGTLFDEKIVKNIIENKVDSVIISINSPNPKTDDFLHGASGSHRKILNGLKLFMKWKKKIHAAFPKIKFNMVITKYNYQNIESMIELAANYEVSEVTVRLVTEPPYKGKPGKLSLPPEKYEEFLEEIKYAEKVAIQKKVNLSKIFDENDFKKYIKLTPDKDAKDVLLNKINPESILTILESEKPFEKLCKSGICTFPFFELYIDANGYASGCGTHASAGEKSDFTEDICYKSLAEIWYGEKLNELRTFMLLSEFPGVCSSCNFINQLKISREWYLK